MPNPQISCPRCATLIIPPPATGLRILPCPSCGSPLEAWFFPALFHRAPVSGQPEPATEGEATCYNHVTRKAVLLCESCGRFLCALCDLETNHRHYCPSCFEARQSAGKLSQLPTELRRYDRIALGLSVFSVFLCCWPSILTAPAVIFVAIRYWNAPGSESSGARFGMIASVVLSLLQLAWWALMIFSLMTVPPPMQEM